MGFKKDFVWGSATASYQVEGGAFEDGKGLNIWDTTTRKENYSFEHQHGDTACDSYHRYNEDIEIMKELCLKAYRYSISWARVMPDGAGKVNEKGLDYYKRLTEELLKNNIEPYVTLFHWDLPYELHKKGGWLNPDIGKYFGEYASVVVNALPEVKSYFTINEPQCIIGAGYVNGDHAPALKVTAQDSLLGIHNTLLAHGYAYRAIKAATPEARVGYAPATAVRIPNRNTREVIEAARRETMRVYDDAWWSNTAWSDPIMFGSYPAEMQKRFEKIMPQFADEDMKIIHTGMDFFAFNTYHGEIVDVNEKGEIYYVKRPDGYPMTTMGWPIDETCLYWGAKFFYERYKKPIIISENGMSATDWVCRDGKVHDAMRVDYIERHLANLKKAADEGVEIDGYFLWSLLDNFEWKQGYSRRFGIVYVDFETKERIIKDSGYKYRDIILSIGEKL